jgi:hypothetical protein
MSETPKLDKVSFPSGYDITDIIVAVKLAARMHVKNVPFGLLEHAVVQRYLRELAARHPESVPFDDPYRLRGQELFDERRSLLNSHLKRHTRAPNGWPGNSPKPAAGNRRRSTSSAIAILSMAKFSPGGFAPWAFATGQPRHDRHGRMAIRNG